jgi:hypothetical protein
MVSSINKITNENIASLLDLSSFISLIITCFEQLQHIIKLAMNITADCNWTGHWLHIGLFKEDLFGLLADYP